MELQNIARIEKASKRARSDSFRLGIGVIFVVMVMLYVSVTEGPGGPHGVMLVAAAVIGGYMAMNIGANDVANNVGPAVGARAISMAGALVIAAVFEAAGALIAGGDVVVTVQKGIIDPGAIEGTDRFIWLMTAALLAGAIWLNIATAIGAPVSTTHSIIGAVLGAGLAAGGTAAAQWGQLGEIAASWVISPVLGGLIAAGFLWWINRSILFRDDRIAAARRMVPLLIGLMVFAFTTYLVLKGLNRVWKVGAGPALGIGAAAGLVGAWLGAMAVRRQAPTLDNSRQGINTLFTWPLIGAAALLSFAHGANDVANAVGPLAAVVDAVRSGAVSGQAGIPLWVMVVGAAGISIGLLLYGPRLIRKVGSEITELDQTRAYCVAMAAAVTVIVASQLGLPVSSTHIAVGGVFGVGFLREFLHRQHSNAIEYIRMHHAGVDKAVVDRFLDDFMHASLERKREMLDHLKRNSAVAEFSKFERKQLRRVYREDLVKRSEVVKIVAAWLVTVPVSSMLGALIYFMIFGMVNA
jgi:PiT family inorganic phosphate transporter